MMDAVDAKEKFMKIYSKEIKRKGAELLLGYLDFYGFFEAPASTKYHGACEGGLVEHSLNVFTKLNELNMDEKIRCKIHKLGDGEYPMETIAICGLLHDICKMDAYEIVKNECDAQQGTTPIYKYTNHFPVGHGEKSVVEIMRFMELSDEEILAIRWHMGGFDYAVRGGSQNMNYAFKQSKLVAMLHIADMMATHLMER